MKHLAFLFACVVFFSCKPDKKTTDTSASGQIQFSLATSTSSSYNLSDITSVNSKSVAINLVRFYICDVKLITENNTEIAVKDYDLIDWRSPDIRTYTNISIPAGTYKAIKFGIGVNNQLNETNPTSVSTGNVLNENRDMYWAWLKYVFCKVEGRVDIDGDGNLETDLRYHIGTNDFYRIAYVSMPTIQVNAGDTKNFKLNLLIDKMFSNDTQSINFSTENYTQSESSQAEQATANKFSTIFSNAFQYQP